MSFNVRSFTCTYNTVTYIHGAIPLCPPFPLLVPLCSPCIPFVSPSTYLAPSSCDRNRPPPSQVACKLTPFAPPFTQLSHPFQIPTTPTAPRLTMTTSGIFRLLLSGTGTIREGKSRESITNNKILNLNAIKFCNIQIVHMSQCALRIFWKEVLSANQDDGSDVTRSKSIMRCYKDRQNVAVTELHLKTGSGESLASGQRPGSDNHRKPKWFSVTYGIWCFSLETKRCIYFYGVFYSFLVMMFIVVQPSATVSTWSLKWDSSAGNTKIIQYCMQTWQTTDTPAAQHACRLDKRQLGKSTLGSKCKV